MTIYQNEKKGKQCIIFGPLKMGFCVPKRIFWGQICTPKNKFLGLYFGKKFLCQITEKIGGRVRPNLKNVIF